MIGDDDFCKPERAPKIACSEVVECFNVSETGLGRCLVGITSDGGAGGPLDI